MDPKQVYDSDLAPVMSTIYAYGKKMPRPAVHDVETRRANVKRTLDAMSAKLKSPSNVAVTAFHATTKDGYALPMFWVHKTSSSSSSSTSSPPKSPKSPRRKKLTPAVVYLHGGGYIAGTAGAMDVPLRNVVADSGVPMLNVDYRLAPEHPFPTPTEDGYAALLWLHTHAAELGVDPARIGVMGASAGGGMAAALALMARDRALSPPLKGQLLITPMLDDFNTKDRGEIEDFYMWRSPDAVTAWAAFLGKGKAGTDGISEYAAPMRATSLKGLPNSYVECGTLDLFVDENIEYAQRMLREGVRTEMHIYAGAPHIYENLVPDAQVSKMTKANRLKFIATL